MSSSRRKSPAALSPTRSSSSTLPTSRTPDVPDFTSENDELEAVFGVIIGATGGRGIFIYDRGGDNIGFYRDFLWENVDFIVRSKSRHVEFHTSFEFPNCDD